MMNESPFEKAVLSIESYSLIFSSNKIKFYYIIFDSIT